MNGYLKGMVELVLEFPGFILVLIQLAIVLVDLFHFEQYFAPSFFILHKDMLEYKNNFISKNLILLIVIISFVLISAIFYYTRAAFIEPTFAPSASDQDFPENILGANNADNDFVSDAVTANNDGSIIERLEYIEDYIAEYDRVDYSYGRGWVASSSGDASIELSYETCENADGWVWFEDGNGDGDTTDAEDGICVATGTISTISWNGDDYSTDEDSTYIAAYTCSGSFPNGTVATYSGFDSVNSADTTWNDGDCALCQADCYDGRKDLPDQIGQDGGSYTSRSNYEGPVTLEVLKDWKGTRLPTAQDFFGFCGATSGDADDTAGDRMYYSSGASSDKTIGDYGHNVGR